MKKVNGVIVIMIVMLLIGCGGKKTSSGFHFDIPDDDEYIYGRGLAESKSREGAIEKANVSASADIALQLEQRIQVYRKRFIEETGLGESSEYLEHFSSATKQVTEKVLEFAKRWKEHVDSPSENRVTYTAEKVIRYPIGAAMEKLAEQIKKREALYTRFRATKAYEDLEKEVQEYREWKKAEGWTD